MDENKKMNLLTETQGSLRKKRKKELERFNYLGMTLIACKSANYENYIALFEKQTGYLAFETDCKTAKECLQKFKEKCSLTGLTKDKAKEIIYKKIIELKKIGIKTPVNE